MVSSIGASVESSQPVFIEGELNVLSNSPTVVPSDNGINDDDDGDESQVNRLRKWVNFCRIKKIRVKPPFCCLLTSIIAMIGGFLTTYFFGQFNIISFSNCHNTRLLSAGTSAIQNLLLNENTHYRSTDGEKLQEASQDEQRYFLPAGIRLLMNLPQPLWIQPEIIEKLFVASKTLGLEQENDYHFTYNGVFSLRLPVPIPSPLIHKVLLVQRGKSVGVQGTKKSWSPLADFSRSSSSDSIRSTNSEGFTNSGDKQNSSIEDELYFVTLNSTCQESAPVSFGSYSRKLYAVYRNKLVWCDTVQK